MPRSRCREFTPDVHGDMVAYAISDGGTDWQVWRFRRVADGPTSRTRCASPSSGASPGRATIRGSTTAATRRCRAGAAMTRAGRRVLPPPRHPAGSTIRGVRGDQPPDARAGRRASPRTGITSSSRSSRGTRRTASICSTCAARRRPAAAVRGLGRALRLHRPASARALFPEHRGRAARTRDRRRRARAGERARASSCTRARGSRGGDLRRRPHHRAATSRMRTGWRASTSATGGPWAR